jgi:Ca2+-transporting ATPase
MVTPNNRTYPLENAHAKSINEITKLLAANQQTGLSEDSIVERIETYELNSYQQQKQKDIFLILFDSLKVPSLYCW